MTEKVTDEMLMAFVDGEIDGATATMIERALGADTGLAARAEMFRASRSLVREAFGEARREPMPERLVAAALAEEQPTVVPFRRRLTPALALPLAACLALAFGVGGYLAGRAGNGGGDTLGHGALAAALGETSSGESRSVALAGGQALLRTLAAYRIEGGVCRGFDVAGPDASLAGVGCDRGQGWTVELTVARPGGDLYAPASEAALHSIDAYLDALEASAPLSDEEEAALAGR